MKRLLAAILGLLFCSVVILTVGFAVSMDEHGNMVDCPYTEGSSSMCAMTGLEHLAQWKMNFVAQVQGLSLLNLSGVVLVLVLIGLLYKEGFGLYIVILKLRQRKNDLLKIVDSFLQLLVLGILHPKVYSKA